jgi:bifunctional non-homologous end joining protein LigD
MACDENGLAVFELLREKPAGQHVFLYAFDLLGLNGKDLKRESFEVRNATLASMLAKAAPSRRQNEHLAQEDGAIVFRHACKPGPQGTVSKRRDSPYRSGRSPDWLQVEEPGLRGGGARGGRGLEQRICTSVCIAHLRQGVFSRNM